MSRALEGNRLMTKDVPSLVTAFDDTAGQFQPANGWQVDTNGTIYYENYFDLGGYNLDDLTTIIDVLALQDTGQYFLQNPFSDSLVTLIDVVCEERLSPDQVSDLSLQGEYPGTPASTQNFDQVKYCGVRGMIPQTDFQSVTLLGNAFGGSMGSAAPTTAAKLWIYRIVRIAATDLTGQVLTIPATRFMLGATVIKESELPYMMRLKRSYELAKNG